MRFLRRIIKRQYLEEIEGDMEERFQEDVERYGLQKARRLYSWDSIKLFHPVLLKKVGGDHRLNQLGMFQYHLAFVLRRLRRRKVYSLTSIIGLSVGLACFYGVFTWWQYLQDYDGFHHEVEEIHAIRASGKNGVDAFTGLAAPLLSAELLQTTFPSVEAATYTAFFFNEKKIKVAYEQQTFYEEGSIMVSDSGFFKVFDFPIVSGDASTPLHAPHQVVLSEPIAVKLFGSADPIGQSLLIQEVPYTVSAVARVPPNSQLQFGYLLSGTSFPADHWRFQWYDLSFPVYVRLQAGASHTAITEALYEHFISGIGNPDIVQLIQQAEISYSLLPFQAIKYQNDFQWPPMGIQNGNLTQDIYLYLLLAAGLIILLIAALNFTNLSLVQQEKDKKSTFVFNLFGKKYSQLGRVLTESLVIYFTAMLMAVGITWVGLQQMTNLPMYYLHYLLTPENLGILFAVAGGLGKLTALGTQVGMSKVVSALRELPPLPAKKPVTLRGGLVVFQFSISMVLLLTSVLVFRQFTFMLKQDLGYQKDQIIYIRDAYLLEEQAWIFKEQVLRYPSIVAASLSDYIPSQILDRNNPLTVPGQEGQHLFGYLVADSSFLDLYQVTETAIYQEGYGANWCIINQAGLTTLGYTDELPTELTVNGTNYRVKSVIDPLFEPLQFASRPTVIVPFPRQPYGREQLSVRFAGDQAEAVLQALKTEWAALTDYPFEYQFLDQSFAHTYRNEQLISNILFLFSWVASIISLMGLLAVVLNMIRMRTKEVAIRKALGAQVEQVVVMLSTTFSKWLLISMAIAVPIAYFLFDHWSENFAVRTAFEPLVIAGVMVAIFLGAILTVAFHTLRAARANPAEYFRGE